MYAYIYIYTYILLPTPHRPQGAPHSREKQGAPRAQGVDSGVVNSRLALSILMLLKHHNMSEGSLRPDQNISVGSSPQTYFDTPTCSPPPRGRSTHRRKVLPPSFPLSPSLSRSRSLSLALCSRIPQTSFGVTEACEGKAQDGG